MSDLTLPPCPTPCDDDCELNPDGCHEEHQPRWKRGHQPHGCEEIRRAILARAVAMAEGIADPAAVEVMKETARREFAKHLDEVRAEERERCAAAIRKHAEECRKLVTGNDPVTAAHLDGLVVAAAFLRDGMEQP